MTAARRSVLLTDGGYKHTLAAIRSLSAAGFEVDALGPKGCLSERSRYLKRLITSPNSLNESSLDDVVTMLRDEKYDAMLTIGARSTLVASQHHQLLSQYTKLFVQQSDAIESCMDKAASFAIAESAKIFVPAYVRIDECTNIREVADQLYFPAVIKKGHELDRSPVVVVRNVQELETALAEYLRKHTKTFRLPIAQSFIDGDACAFFALYQHGELRQAFMHRRIREVPADGGASCCAESIYEQDLFETGKRILDEFQWHGVAMVEFKRERATGRLALMEINPKFWGSLDLAIAAGVDFPTLAVRSALGETIESVDYRVGVRFHWPVGGGEILHVLQRPQSAWRVFRDCIDRKVASNIRLCDPLPAWRAFREDFRALRNRRRMAKD